MGLRKAVGARRTVARGSRQRRLLERHGIEFVEAEVASIDPANRIAETTVGTLSGDNLVLALGAVSRPDLVPGLGERGHDV